MSGNWIVIPCFNEGNRLNKSSFLSFVNSNSFSILFVDDGSRDSTFRILQEMNQAHDNIHILKLADNSGQAEAVRQGFQYCFQHFSVDTIGYFDADLATPLSEAAPMLSVLSKNEMDYIAVTGLRIKRLGAEVYRSAFRHYLGRIFATIVSFLLDLPVYDTQCGAKLFKAEPAKKIMTNKFRSNWFFDVEIIFRLKSIYGRNHIISHVYEYPLYSWKEISGSKLKLKHYFLAPLELLKIFLKYRNKEKA